MPIKKDYTCFTLVKRNTNVRGNYKKNYRTFYGK